MLEPNLWMANAPGSTLFMPVADASEQVSGSWPWPWRTATCSSTTWPAARPVTWRLSSAAASCDEDKRIPLTVLQQMAYEANVAELAFVGHNMVLTMQAMGLGGLYLNGLNRWSVLGAFGDSGIHGARVPLRHGPRWTLPNPSGSTATSRASARRT
jgi:hypothetical protein